MSPQLGIHVLVNPLDVGCCVPLCVANPIKGRRGVRPRRPRLSNDQRDPGQGTTTLLSQEQLPSLSHREVEHESSCFSVSRIAIPELSGDAPMPLPVPVSLCGNPGQVKETHLGVNHERAQFKEPAQGKIPFHHVHCLVNPLDVPQHVPSGRVNPVQRCRSAIVAVLRERDGVACQSTTPILPLEQAPGILDGDLEGVVPTSTVRFDVLPEPCGDFPVAPPLRGPRPLLVAAAPTSHWRTLLFAPVTKVSRRVRGLSPAIAPTPPHRTQPFHHNQLPETLAEKVYPFCHPASYVRHHPYRCGIGNLP